MSETTREKVLTLHAEGLRQVDIARQIGVSAERVGQIVRQKRRRDLIERLRRAEEAEECHA